MSSCVSARKSTSSVTRLAVPARGGTKPRILGAPFALQCRDRIPHVRRLDEFPVQIGRVTATASSKRSASRSHKSVNDSRSGESARHLRAAAARVQRRAQSQCDGGHDAIDRHRPLRHPDRASCQRLDDAGNGRDVRKVNLLQQPARCVRQAQAERGADAAIPGTEQLFAEAASLALGRNHGVGAPRRLNLFSAER